MKLISAMCAAAIAAFTAAAQAISPLPNSEAWKRLPYGTTATGSTYVPLDSWIYTAFERLVAWGYIDSAYLDLRPWTRLSCVRMLQRAEELFRSDSGNNEARRTYSALRKEFKQDYIAATRDTPSPHLEIDSLYQRSLGIAGPPINDSFHFGQTLINDYGRPFQEGFNQIAGLSARGEYGPFSLSFRGEYQLSPGRAPYSPAVQQAIAVMDSNPVLPATKVSRTSTFSLLDGNFSTSLAGNEISFGKSELW